MLPGCVHGFKRFQELPKIENKVAALARELGLDNVEPDHVTELLESDFQLLTNEERGDMAV